MVGRKEWQFCEFPTGPEEDGGKVTRRHRMAVLEAPSMGAQVGGNKRKDRERDAVFTGINTGLVLGQDWFRSRKLHFNLPVAF